MSGEGERNGSFDRWVGWNGEGKERGRKAGGGGLVIAVEEDEEEDEHDEELGRC